MRARPPWSVLRGAVEVVYRLDVANRAARRPHDDRVRDRAALYVAHRAQVVTRRDAGRREEDRPRSELVESVTALEVVEPDRAAEPRLVLVSRLESRLHLAAEADERRRGEDALRRAADAEQQVDAGERLRRRDRRRHVAAGEELDARPRAPHLLDQLVVARPVE